MQATSFEHTASPLHERYRIVRAIGSGGMADVYEVEHLTLGRHFALKRLRADQASHARVRERFETEARLLAQLESPHVVAIVDAGTADDGLPYYVMELLRGSDLRSLLAREGRLPVRRAVHVALDLCRALEAVHGAGVVHRDLKPENVWVTTDHRGRDLCKLLDFGVAKSQARAITRHDALLGTARYMAPEQFDGEGRVGPASDLFALGILLYECLTGEPPFDGENTEQVLFRILHEPAPAVREHCPQLPLELVAVLERALAKQTSARFGSARELAGVLEAWLERPAVVERSNAHEQSVAHDQARTNWATLAEPASVVPAQEVARPVVRPRRRRALVGLGVVLALALAVGFAVRKDVPGHAPAPPRAEKAVAARVEPPAALPAGNNAALPELTRKKPPSAPSRRTKPRVTKSVPSQPEESRPALFFPSNAP